MKKELKGLEEIFWAGTKFVNSKGETVNPKSIGIPTQITDYERNFPKLQEKLREEIIRRKLPDINAFSRSENSNYLLMHQCHSCYVQFYKI
jgi:hypothetical protein